MHEDLIEITFLTVMLKAFFPPKTFFFFCFFFFVKNHTENSAQMETGTMPWNSVNCHHGNQKNKPFWNWYRRHTLSNSSIFLPPSMLKNKMPCHCEVRERKHHERDGDAYCLVNKKIKNKLHTANAISPYPVNLFERERSSKDGQDWGMDST